MRAPVSLLAVLVPVLLVPIAACSSSSPVSPAPPPVAAADGGAGPGTAQTGGPTYTKDVLPILQGSCQKCHVAGGIAPFALTTYDDAKNMIGPIVEATRKRVMPPWGALDTNQCTPPRPWKEDMRLSDAELATLDAWKKAGTPEGTASDAPPPRAPDPSGLPGANFTAQPAPYQLASSTTDAFRCFVIDPKLAATQYMTGAFFVPGNPTIVHHALLFSDPNRESLAKADANGQYDCPGGSGNAGASLLAAWAPGGVPMELPDGAGAPLEANTLLVMQVHYHPHGARNDPDSTALQLRLSDAPPAWYAITRLIGNYRGAIGTSGDGLQAGPDDNGAPRFLIPANASQHTETMRLTVPAKAGSLATPKLYLYSVGAHMHLVGVDEKIWIHRAAGASGSDPQDQCLLQEPQWNFNWQRAYVYDVPIENLPVVSPGDQLWARCTYDNTTSNAALAASLAAQGKSGPSDVTLGETTLDEMCLGAYTFLAKAP